MSSIVTRPGRRIAPLLCAVALALLTTAVCGQSEARRASTRRQDQRKRFTFDQVRRMPERSRLRRDPAGGLGFCRAALAPRDRAHGGRTCVIFDIDNTLVDTRARTLAAAHAFGRKAGQPALSRLTLAQVGYNGALTARDQGLGRIVAGSFDRYWNSFFWSVRNFKHDRPIRQTIQLARNAKQAGAEVFYLTGRVEALKAGTLRQLRKLGLPDADAAHVICKPSLAVKTAPFKRATIDTMLERDHRRIAWFMSDSSADIAHVRGSGVACVWVDFPVKPPHEATISEVPTIRIRSAR